MAEYLKTIPEGVEVQSNGQGRVAQLHLLIDADRYWFPASTEDLCGMSGFLKVSPDVELTLITRESAWDTGLVLTGLPWFLPRHLIAEHGETILHLSNRGEWSPDTAFGDWKRLLGNPRDYERPRHLSSQVVAIEYLECNCDSPRPLLVCIGSPELKFIIGLADTAYLPRSWACVNNLPVDTAFLTDPPLKSILQMLESRRQHDHQATRAIQLEPSLKGN